jgi:hypothetical protein
LDRIKVQIYWIINESAIYLNNLKTTRILVYSFLLKVKYFIAMLKRYAGILFCLALCTNCKKEAEKEPVVKEPEITEKSLTGTYEGYKFFNKSYKDSLAVTMKVEWISDKKMNIEEITPFKHIKQIELTGFDFTYDRGIGEDDCGRITMTGAGNFKGTSLYVIETIKCTKANRPDKFVEYKVTKTQ